MAKIEEILTKLVYDAIERYASLLAIPFPREELIDSAITNATKQIRQQQRERVENVVKYIEMAKRVLLRVGRTFDIVDVGDSLDAALKELEATNE